MIVLTGALLHLQIYQPDVEMTTLLTILELYAEQCQAERSPEFHGQRGVDPEGDRDGRRLVRGSEETEIRLGASLDRRRLQLPSLDFQLHPPLKLE